MKPWYAYVAFTAVFLGLIVAATLKVEKAAEGIPILLAAFLGWITPSPKELDK